MTKEESLARHVQNWISTDEKDAEAREQMYHAVRAVARFRQALKVVCDNGKFDEAQIARSLGTNGNS